MNEEHLPTSALTAETYTQIYLRILQLSTENGAKIKELQDTQDKLQRSLAILPPFIKELKNYSPANLEWSGTVHATGVMLYNEFNQYGGSITAGTSSISLGTSIASFVHKAKTYDVNSFNESEITLISLSMPIRSNLESLEQLIQRYWPELTALAKSISESLQQTTDERRYEHGGTKLRELLSAAGQQLAPDSCEPFPEWLERTDKKKLTQVSRWHFTFFRYLEEIIYPTDLRDKCCRLAKCLRDDYANLNRFTHNRGDAVMTPQMAEPLIHQTVTHLQEVFTLLDETAKARRTMVQAELLKAISNDLKIASHIDNINNIIESFELRNDCGLTESFSLNFPTENGELRADVKVEMLQRVRVSLQVVRSNLLE